MTMDQWIALFVMLVVVVLSVGVRGFLGRIAIFLSLVIGYLVWGDVPNSLAWAGIGLLVASGVYLLHSERRRNHAALETAADQGL